MCVCFYNCVHIAVCLWGSLYCMLAVCVRMGVCVWCLAVRLRQVVGVYVQLLMWEMWGSVLWWQWCTVWRISMCVCVGCGSRRLVTHCMCPPFPRLLAETLVGGACTGWANGESLFLMVGKRKKTGRYSHKEHPGKWKDVLFIKTCSYGCLC